MKKFILWLNNDDNEPQFEVVEAKDEQTALGSFLAEMFDIEDDEMGKNMANAMLRDEFYGVGQLDLGPVEFTFYYDLESLGL